MTARAWIIDDQPSRRYPIYTRGNVGEVFPDVVSPLTWSAFGPEAEAGWRAAFTEWGAALASDFDEPMVILGVFGGYAYLNVSYIRLFAERTPGLSAADMDRQLFGDSGAPPYQPKPGDKNLRATIKVAGSLLRTLRAKSLPRLEADKVKVSSWLASRPDPETASDGQLIDTLLQYRPLFRQLFQTHILTTFQSYVGPGAVAQLCEGKLGDPTLTNKLLSGIGSVESAAPSIAMWELGRMATEDPSVAALFDAGLDGLEDRLAAAPASTEFHKRFTAFLDEFGSRGPNEWEFGSETWGVRPGLALAAIDRMRAADASHAPTLQHDRLERERLAATASARSRLRGPARLQFDMALRSAQLFSQGRERSKTTVIRATHGVRLRLRELARRCRDRGGPPSRATSAS